MNSTRRGAAVAVRRARLHRRVVEVNQVRSGDRQSDGDRRPADRTPLRPGCGTAARSARSFGRFAASRSRETVADPPEAQPGEKKGERPRRSPSRCPGRPRSDWPVDRSPPRGTWRPPWRRSLGRPAVRARCRYLHVPDPPPAGPAGAPLARLGQADFMNAAVGDWPALLTTSLEMAHALGMFGGLAMIWSPAGVSENPMPLPCAERDTWCAPGRSGAAAPRSTSACSGGHEDHQRAGHGGQRPAYEHAGSDTQREGEGGVARSG